LVTAGRSKARLLVVNDVVLDPVPSQKEGKRARVAKRMKLASLGGGKGSVSLVLVEDRPRI
jgi:hypothetical protein